MISAASGTAPPLGVALQCVRWGFATFPLHYPVDRNGRLFCSCGSRQCKNEAKHPYPRLAPKGLLSASKDPAAIERWWGPGVPYNIGARTGEESGVVVIDVDPRHGGDETLAELERRFGVLPPTWRFRPAAAVSTSCSATPVIACRTRMVAVASAMGSTFALMAAISSPPAVDISRDVITRSRSTIIRTRSP